MSQMPQQSSYQPPVPPFNKEEVAQKKLITGILAIVLGGFGVHRFMLGDTTGGVIRLLLGCVCVGGIIGIVEGIIYLTKSDEQFYQEYMVQKKAWF